MVKGQCYRDVIGSENVKIVFSHIYS